MKETERKRRRVYTESSEICGLREYVKAQKTVYVCVLITKKIMKSVFSVLKPTS